MLTSEGEGTSDVTHSGESVCPLCPSLLSMGPKTFLYLSVLRRSPSSNVTLLRPTNGSPLRSGTNGWAPVYVLKSAESWALRENSTREAICLDLRGAEQDFLQQSSRAEMTSGAAHEVRKTFLACTLSRLPICPGTGIVRLSYALRR